MTALVISNQEMKYIMKWVKSCEEPDMNQKCVRVEYISKEVEKFMDNKNITTNTFRIQSNYSVMGRYFCIGFIDFMLNSKSLFYEWILKDECEKILLS